MGFDSVHALDSLYGRCWANNRAWAYGGERGSDPGAPAGAEAGAEGHPTLLVVVGVVLGSCGEMRSSVLGKVVLGVRGRWRGLRRNGIDEAVAGVALGVGMDTGL